MATPYPDFLKTHPFPASAPTTGRIRVYIHDGGLVRLYANPYGKRPSFSSLKVAERVLDRLRFDHDARALLVNQAGQICHTVLL